MSATPPATVPSPPKFMLPRSDAVPRFPVGDVTKKAYRPLRVASEAGSVIMTTELALFVGSVIDLAVTVTWPPAGTTAGAV